MYGPGIAPPQPRPAGRGTVIGLRVLFAVLPVVTLGVGAWGSFLRLALLLRRPLDWALVPLAGVVGTGGFMLVGTGRDDNSWQTNVGTACLLVCMAVTPTYFLIMDIRRTRPERGPATAALAPRPYTHPYGYEPGLIPGAAPPATGPGHAGTSIPGPTPFGHDRREPAPPLPPTGPRIDQVRAELDELSHFLRKEEGR